MAENCSTQVYQQKETPYMTIQIVHDQGQPGNYRIRVIFKDGRIDYLADETGIKNFWSLSEAKRVMEQIV